MADDLGTTMDTLLECLCSALEDVGRPVCACGATIGSPMLSPAECCECEGAGGQLSVQFDRMYPADGVTFDEITRVESCRPGAVAADLAFTLARCHPTLDAKGNPPKLAKLEPFVQGMQADVQTLWNALACCETKVAIRDVAVDAPPDGGCSGVGIRVTVLVKPVTPVVVS